MAIQPIDLQTLFTQLDKVGKSQASQKEGLAAQQAVQQIEGQKKIEEQIQSVNEAEDAKEDGKINDREGRRKNGSRHEETGKNRAKNDDGEENAAKPSFIRDPALGRNVDIEL
ncbi:MAG: hypothetical protein LBS06_06190 [Treponema sp.]|jgi:hypothetical protein|nr:hypothetical protein [Treponema sp.]